MLLEQTYAHERSRFCPLIQTVLREAIKYRDKKGNALKREEVESLNTLLLDLGFKIPALHDRDFLATLPRGEGEPQIRRSVVSNTELAALRRQYETMETNPDLQSRGYEFQDLLFKIFKAFGLDPRPPFRLTSEQIDGSFVLDSEIYLLEARWRKNKADPTALYAFSHKVESKSEWSRGLFISMAGFTQGALDGIASGKAPNFVVMCRPEIESILAGKIRLDDIVRQKVRHLAETGKMFLQDKD
jgi:hypothetical protein